MHSQVGYIRTTKGLAILLVVAGNLFRASICCAAHEVGWVIGWGNNISGEATGTPSFAASNGLVVTTGSGFATGLVTVASDVLNNAYAISAGYTHGLALRKDGTVAGWGDNSFGKAIGSPTPWPHRAGGFVRIPGKTLANAVSIVAGRDFSLTVDAAGVVVTWGENIVPEGVADISGIAAEEGSSWVLRRDGTVWGWGTMRFNAGYGQLRQVTALSNVIAISVGPGGY